MDPTRFDRLSRAIARRVASPSGVRAPAAGGATRRSALGGVAGLAAGRLLGGAAFRTATAAVVRCKTVGAACRAPEECCSGRCNRKLSFSKKKRCDYLKAGRQLPHACGDETPDGYHVEQACDTGRCYATRAGCPDNTCSIESGAAGAHHPRCADDCDCWEPAATCVNGRCCLPPGAGGATDRGCCSRTAGYVPSTGEYVCRESGCAKRGAGCAQLTDCCKGECVGGACVYCAPLGRGCSQRGDEFDLPCCPGQGTCNPKTEICE